MEYQDFTIDICSIQGGRFQAWVDPADRDAPPVVFDRPLAPQLLEALHGKRAQKKEKAGPPPPSPEEVGQQLFSAIFRKEIESAFRVRESALDGADSGLRIRLRFRLDDTQADYLAALPWEWLWDPQRGRFVSSNPKTPVVRDLLRSPGRSDGPPREIPLLERPLRMLVIDALPIDKGFLKLDREAHRIFRALKPLEDSGDLELVGLQHNSIQELHEVLQTEPIHVLHFMGHGGYDEASGFGAVFFEGPDEREVQVGGIAFAEYLKSSRDLRLVVLNACSTARYTSPVNAPLYSGVASAILDQTGMPAVVANQNTISDQAAISFSATFYEHIAEGAGVEEALTAVRNQLVEQSSEWATPVLFLAAQQSKLLNRKRSKKKRSIRLRDLRTSKPIRLAVRSFDGWGGDMAERGKVLELLAYFEGRHIKNPKWWNGKILPELQNFLLKHGDLRRPLILDFAAHSSIAFAAGWVLEAKSGFDVRVPQRVHGAGEREWDRNEGKVPEGPLWLDRPDIRLSEDAPDVALSLAVSVPGVSDHVETFIRSRNLPIGRIVDAVVPEPSSNAVLGGAHALRLAQTLLPRIRQRYPHERSGKLHLFCAAPNALVFYLGQLSRSLGRVVLYEFAFGEGDSYGRYEPSIELPPPVESSEPPKP